MSTIIRDLPSPAVARAVTALHVFGVLDASTAARLLPMWRRYAELTPADVDTIIAWFVDSGDEFIRVDEPPSPAEFKPTPALTFTATKVAEALCAAGCVTRDQAVALMPSLPLNVWLTGVERAAVLGHLFPDGSAGGAR